MNGRQLDRRQVLAGAGALAALGALWRPVEGVALRPQGPFSVGEGSESGAKLVVDVACLGDTLSANFDEALDAATGDMRGVGFLVEGYLYPARTIPDGEVFDPSSTTATGHWLCCGWFMFHPGRPLPHALTTQEYLLGLIRETQFSPEDQLVSSGVEGGGPVTTRSVIGGTGHYRKARGEVIQEVIGTNTTVLNDIGEPAPNFRFSFHL